MTLFPTQSQHGRPLTHNPVFDRLLAADREANRRRLAPITTRSVLVDRASTPVLASMLRDPSGKEARSSA